MYYAITVAPYKRAEYSDGTVRTPRDVTAVAYLYRAFKLPPAMGGVELGEKKTDYDVATELARLFRFFMVPSPGRRGGEVEYHVREDGGTQFISSAACALLKECWFVEDRRGKKTGMRQHMGVGDLEDTIDVEDYLHALVPLSTDEKRQREIALSAADPSPSPQE